MTTPQPLTIELADGSRWLIDRNGEAHVVRYPTRYNTSMLRLALRRRDAAHAASWSLPAPEEPGHER